MTKMFMLRLLAVLWLTTGLHGQTMAPTGSDSPVTTVSPTASQENSPTSVPTSFPTGEPTMEPTSAPTASPTLSLAPSISPGPSAEPTMTRMPTAEPTSRPTRFDPPEEEEEETPIAVIVIVLLIAVMVPICCGCNRSRIVVDNFQSAEQAAKDFRDEIMTKRRFVLTTPAITACGKSLPRREYALFFSTRIKAHWKPLHTYVQMGLGWLGLATTIVALFVPDNNTNNVVGFAALFMSELLTHTWYGYIRYLFKGCGGMCSRDGVDNIDESDFEDMKYLFGILYHGGHHELENAYLVDLMGLPFYAVMYVSTAIAFLGTFIALLVLKCAGNDDNRRRRKNEDTLDAKAMGGLSAFVGVAMGCFVYPLLFLALTTPGGKVFASFMHHCLNEYYEAKLFRKKPAELIWSIVLKAFGDFVGVEDFDDNPDFKDAWNELQSNLDKEDVSGYVKRGGNDEDPENPQLRQVVLTARDKSNTGNSAGPFPLQQAPSSVPIRVLPAAPPLETGSTHDEHGESSMSTELEASEKSRVISTLSDADLLPVSIHGERKKKKKKKKKKRESTSLGQDESGVSEDISRADLEGKKRKQSRKSKEKQEPSSHDDSEISEDVVRAGMDKRKKNKKEKVHVHSERDESENSDDVVHSGIDGGRKKKRKGKKREHSVRDDSEVSESEVHASLEGGGNTKGIEKESGDKESE